MRCGLGHLVISTGTISQYSFSDSISAMSWRSTGHGIATEQSENHMPTVAVQRKEITSALCLKETCSWLPSKSILPSSSTLACTEHICIGPCIFHCSQVARAQLEILAQLHYEIEVRVRLPLSLDGLCMQEDIWMAPRESPSGYFESISRCVAAFQRTADADQHLHRANIAGKIKSYAEALSLKCPAHSRTAVMKLIHDYVRNRTYNLALKFILDASLKTERHLFWCCMRDERQRNDCLNIIERCQQHLTDEECGLRRELATMYR